VINFKKNLPCFEEIYEELTSKKQSWVKISAGNIKEGGSKEDYEHLYSSIPTFQNFQNRVKTPKVRSATLLLRFSYMIENLRGGCFERELVSSFEMFI
jgi:hypothetical protein